MMGQRSMRRKEWERNEQFAWKVFDEAPYAVLALADEVGAPYCVAVSPAREGKTVYFHCAREGLKLELLIKNPQVAMSAVSHCKPISPNYTMSYASVILRGKAKIVTDETEKALALRRISERYSANDLEQFDTMMEQYAKATHVVRIDVEQITGKEACNG